MRAMGRRSWWFLLALLLLPSASLADVEVDERVQPPHDCRIPDPERPYICDVGPPGVLSMQSFVELAQRDYAIMATIARIGMPDRAELQRIKVSQPWLGWEVRIYYRSLNYMYAFGRSFILGNPEVSLIRYEGKMPARLWVRPLTAEQAAARAEQAALEAEQLADRADQYADRAEYSADQLARDFHRSLTKH